MRIPTEPIITGSSTLPSNTNLDDLLGTYARLKEQGIIPVLCTDSGVQNAFYYEDLDRNSVE